MTYDEICVRFVELAIVFTVGFLCGIGYYRLRIFKYNLKESKKRRN